MKCKACDQHDYQGHAFDCPWVLLEEARLEIEQLKAPNGETKTTREQRERLEAWVATCVDIAPVNYDLALDLIHDADLAERAIAERDAAVDALRKIEGLETVNANNSIAIHSLRDYVERDKLDQILADWRSGK
jgi:DNA-binding helix-hairpin-helix protein with protein kinase domain